MLKEHQVRYSRRHHTENKKWLQRPQWRQHRSSLIVHEVYKRSANNRVAAKRRMFHNILHHPSHIGGSVGEKKEDPPMYT